MAPEASSALIQWFVDYFSGNNQENAVLGGIVYEMFGLNDSFGRVMLNNLKVFRHFKPEYVLCAVNCRRFFFLPTPIIIPVEERVAAGC